jgi:DNA-binding transcriptional LysR family regulator
MAHAARGARVALRTNSLIALRTAIEVGIGVGVLPIPGANLRRPLVCLHKLERKAHREAFLVYHADLRRSPRVQAVARAVTAILSPQYRSST